MSIAAKPTKSELTAERIRTIAYNMDLLIPGFYLWAGDLVMQIGGEKPDDRPHRYPGTLHSNFGIAWVLPDYRILTTYRGHL
jgi:hypothetical protein